MKKDWFGLQYLFDNRVHYKTIGKGKPSLMSRGIYWWMCLSSGLNPLLYHRKFQTLFWNQRQIHFSLWLFGEPILMSCRVDHYVTDFEGWFSKAQIFNPYKGAIFALFARKSPLRASSVQLAWSAKLIWQAKQSWRVDGHYCPPTYT